MRTTPRLSKGTLNPQSNPRFFLPALSLFLHRPSAVCPAVRTAHASTITQRACVSLLLLHRHLSRDNGDHLPPGTPAVAAADGSPTGEEDDEDLKVETYRPQLSPEDAERKAKTDLFVCLLLTLPRDQDWKDMLAAAFRAGTWKPHHLNAVLHGVQLNKYNEPAECAVSCAASLPFSCSSALRHSIVDASKTAPASSTPSTRLQRARDILIFCTEEGGVHAAPSAEGLFVGVSKAPLSSAEEASRPSKAFAPSAAAAHHLLVLLLQAAQRGASATSPLSDPNTTTQPVASFHDVWSFLAWMELHEYHILSNAVLDALEAVVDEGGSQAGAEAAAGLKSAAGLSSAPFASPLKYAVVSRRVHRLDYLRSERALLRESMKSAEQGANGARMSTGAVRGTRWRDAPRTAPVHTE
ncbi:conserved hypothetical protein [Leishmania braziliensis MHOM/BR/75/M2904]|uniref:Uncharacterized protein n=2 Tax=Leishmania braziliensis TaxID=5660 RepID=A4HJF6_LEIBR|nr:conserved hypothetical protein [Leishmania braziliensis MHOM/BR/75/M2904]CAJ2477950.1 unnamed protein product [Leishmania braziliensis]CAM42617.1 conserved hypothetical protein [Leishmania braziliensis MHOM/BR/75/M2904]